MRINLSNVRLRELSFAKAHLGANALPLTPSRGNSSLRSELRIRAKLYEMLESLFRENKEK